MPGPTTPASGPVALPKSLPTGLQQTARLESWAKRCKMRVCHRNPPIQWFSSRHNSKKQLARYGALCGGRPSAD